MMTLKRVLSLMMLIACVITSHAQEPIAVVVNKTNPTEQLSKSELIDLFMGKYVAFPNNTQAIPVELAADNEIKIEFYQNLVGMPLSRVNAYWSRLRFTGRKRVSVMQKTNEDVISFIKANKQAIGYIPKSQLTSGLKVVYIINE